MLSQQINSSCQFAVNLLQMTVRCRKVTPLPDRATWLHLLCSLLGTTVQTNAIQWNVHAINIYFYDAYNVQYLYPVTPHGCPPSWEPLT